MEFRRIESVKGSIIAVVISLVIIGLLFYCCEGIVPGLIFCGLVIGFLEYQRYKNATQLLSVVYKDELTDLPNFEHMLKVIDSRMKKNEPFFLVTFDVKNFKIINDLWGYEKGDEHLRFIGDKIKELTDVFEFACRCENDNFAVLLRNSSIEIARAVLEIFFEEISALPSDANYHVQYSCGVVQQDGNYESAINLFDCAKIAKGLGKRYNNTQIIVYDENAKSEMIRRQHLKDNFHAGMENDEFMVYLQPKYNMEDDTLAGAEALIRWKYKHEQFVPLSEFIPVFEEDGTIGIIDQFVLEQVCDKFKEWEEKGMKLLPISVNVSRVRMANRNLIRDIAETVRKREVSFEYIDLELTESAAFDNMERLLYVMNEIKNAGFKLSMDDFGTGYSSLSLLQQMPLDTLKLDKTFVDGYIDESCEKGRLMICDIINMAHHLNIRVLAEGVETEVQRDMLKEAGCEAVQGYYYSKPIPIAEYEELLKQMPREAVAQ